MKRIYLVIILILSILIAWQIMDIKVTYRKIAFIKSKGASNSKDDLKSLQKVATKQKEYLDYVEKVALWQLDIDPLSWLTQQTDELGIQITGVDRLPTTKVLEYEQLPITIAVRGNYNLLGMFINRLEHSTNAFRIDSLRINCKESDLDQTTMSISLSYFRRAGDRS